MRKQKPKEMVIKRTYSKMKLADYKPFYFVAGERSSLQFICSGVYGM